VRVAPRIPPAPVGAHPGLSTEKEKKIGEEEARRVEVEMGRLHDARLTVARQRDVSPVTLAYNHLHADGAPQRALSAVFLFRRQRRGRHVHVERNANRAKFWLDPVRLAESGGFGRAELGRVEALVRDNANRLRRGWDEYFAE
jgi:hypothetical protein